MAKESPPPKLTDGDEDTINADVTPSKSPRISPPTPTFERSPIPEPIPEEEFQARRRRLAERMAKLGGTRFGAPPPVGIPPPPNPQVVSEAEEVGERRSKEEEPEEEDEQARRQKITAKLAGMGGMRIGMVPGAILPPKPPAPIHKENASTEQPDTKSPPSPPPSVREPPPPARAPPPPIRFDTGNVSEDDTARVEMEESETEEVHYQASPIPGPGNLKKRSSDSVPSPTQNSALSRVAPPTLSDYVKAEELHIREESISPPPSLATRPPWTALPSPKAPPKDRITGQMTSSQLKANWLRVGTQVNEVTRELFEKSKKTVVGDGTYVGFVNAVLDKVPNASTVEEGASSFGHLIYVQTGPLVIRRVADIMPGDIIVLQDAKLKGHKGLKTYHHNIGQGFPVVAIIDEHRSRKSTVKAYQAVQQAGNQSVESVTYRLEDMKTGTIKVFRVLEDHVWAGIKMSESSPDGIKAPVSPPSEDDHSRTSVDGPLLDAKDAHVLLPTILPAPTTTNRDPREEIVNEILDLTDQVASVALFGSIGVGKSFVARTALDHKRTEAKFGQKRHLMRCDDLADSLEGFLERLSETIYTDRTTSVAQLRSYLESSPPLLLLLDGVDYILDPLTSESEKIYATIEEFGSYGHVSLVTTSRTNLEIHGFHRVEVPTPSEDNSRDIFYSLCSLGRSLAVDSLIARLDSHPLSIEHIASCVRENNWDELMLLKTWNDDHTSALKTSYYERLKETVEPVLNSSTIKSLGTVAQDVLEAIAAFPSGIRECDLEGIFHKTVEIGEVVDILCKPSLVHRNGGFVRMISPFQFYFLESMIAPARTEEIINVRWGPNCMPAPAWLPIYTEGPPTCQRTDCMGEVVSSLPPQRTQSRMTPRFEAPRKRWWIRRLPQFVKNRLLALFGSRITPNVFIEIQTDPTNTPPAVPEQRVMPAPVAYNIY